MSYIQGTYKFDVSGKVAIPAETAVSRMSRAGGLYEKNGDSYTSVSGYIKASEVTSTLRGMSVPYKDHVSVTLEVNDNPFNSSVRECHENVGGLTHNVSSLTATTVATSTQLAAVKAEASRKIGKSLSNGFFNYISYMIKEKMTALEAKIPATVSTMALQGQSLQGRQKTLEGDYQRITSRYSVIINQLNENLEYRLMELDRPVFELCNSVTQDVFTDPIGFAFGQCVYAGNEQLRLTDATKLTVVRQNTVRVLKQLNQYIQNLQKLAQGLEQILQKRELAGKRQKHVPAVCMVYDSLRAEAKGKIVYLPEEFKARCGEAGVKLISENYPATCPKKDSDEMQRLDACIQRKISEYSAGKGTDAPSVAKLIQTMWNNSKKNLFS